MASKRAWYSLALLLSACAIPNISVVESLDETTGGSGSNESGATNQAGTKNNNQGGSSGEPDMGAGSDAGGDPNGGTNTAGTGPSGGNSPSGGTSPAGGGGTGPMPAKTAVAKFCNAVVVGGESVSLDLRVGSGANLVHIVAESGTCSPVVDRACVPIQTGSAVPLGIFDLNGEQIYDANVLIEPGDAWIFTLYFDELTQRAQLAGQSDITASDCSATDFEDLPL
jgi:hypothetical protein